MFHYFLLVVILFVVKIIFFFLFEIKILNKYINLLYNFYFIKMMRNLKSRKLKIH